MRFYSPLLPLLALLGACCCCSAWAEMTSKHGVSTPLSLLEEAELLQAPYDEAADKAELEDATPLVESPYTSPLSTKESPREVLEVDPLKDFHFVWVPQHSMSLKTGTNLQVGGGTSRVLLPGATVSYGLTDRLSLEVGVPKTEVAFHAADVSGVGNLMVGTKWVLNPYPQRVTAAIGTALLLPLGSRTQGESEGIGESKVTPQITPLVSGELSKRFWFFAESPVLYTDDLNRRRLLVEPYAMVGLTLTPRWHVAPTFQGSYLQGGKPETSVGAAVFFEQTPKQWWQLSASKGLSNSTPRYQVAVQYFLRLNTPWSRFYGL